MSNPDKPTEVTTKRVFERPLNGAYMSTDGGEDLVNVYVAGVLEAEQAIRCTINKAGDSRVGYRIIPKIEMQTTSRELSNVIMNWLNSLGIFTSMETLGSERPKYKVSVTRRSDVKRILETISPYLIVHDREAEILLEEVIPRLDDERVLTEERFIEVVAFVDQIATAGPSPNRQYDLEFFKDEFGIERDEERAS